MAYKNQKKKKAHIAELWKDKYSLRNATTREAANQNAAKQNLIITWKRGIDHVSVPPFTDSFFTRSIGAALKIIDRRRRDNMESAFYEGHDLLKAKA